jgi:hypothetical protein
LNQENLEDKNNMDSKKKSLAMSSIRKKSNLIDESSGFIERGSS